MTPWNHAIPTADMTAAVNRNPAPAVLAHQPGTWLDPDPDVSVGQWLAETGNTGRCVVVPLRSEDSAVFSSIELHLVAGQATVSARGWVSIDLTADPPGAACGQDASVAAAVLVDQYGADALDQGDARWLHARFDVADPPAGWTQARVVEALQASNPVDALATDVRGHLFWETCAATANGWAAA